MRRGCNTLKTEGIGVASQDNCCPTMPNNPNDFKVCSSEVMCHRHNLSVNPTNFGRSRGLSPSEKKPCRKDQVLQGEKMPYGEGQKIYPKTKSKDLNSGEPCDKGKRHLQKSKRSEETVDTSSRMERFCKTPLSSSECATTGSDRKLLSGKQNAVIQGKLSSCQSGTNRYSHERSSYSQNQTLTVANLETLVIQPGSPTVIEVRSGGRQEKNISNYSDSIDTDNNISEVESICDCEPVSDVGTEPLDYCSSPENKKDNVDLNGCQQKQVDEVKPPCTIKLSKSRKESEANQAILEEISQGQKLSEGISDRKSNLKSPFSPPRRITVDKQEGNQGFNQDSPLNQTHEFNMCGPTTMANEYKKPVVPCPSNRGNKEKPSLCSSNRGSKEIKEAKELCASNRDKDKINNSNSNKQISIPLITQKPSKPDSSAENEVRSKELQSHTLTLSNLDTLVIQPGSPTLIQVRQARNSKDKQDCEREQCKVEYKNECESDLDQIPDGGGKLSKCQEYTNVNDCEGNSTKNNCSEKQLKVNKKSSGVKDNACPNDQQYPTVQIPTSQYSTTSCPDQRVSEFDTKLLPVKTSQTKKQNCACNNRQKQPISPPNTYAPQQYQPNVNCQIPPAYVSQSQPSPQAEFAYSPMVGSQSQQMARPSHQAENVFPSMLPCQNNQPSLQTEDVYQMPALQSQHNSQLPADYSWSKLNPRKPSKKSWWDYPYPPEVQHDQYNRIRSMPMYQQQMAQYQAPVQQYQQYMCVPPKQSQQYNKLYQQPAQQPLIDYQQMQPFDQPLTAQPQYQNEYDYCNDNQQYNVTTYTETQCSDDYEVTDTQCSTGCNVPENYYDPSQINEPNLLTNANCQENQNVAPSYYDCCPAYQ